MLKTIISEQYRNIVRMIEIILVVLLIPLLYHFVPIDKKASETLYIDGQTLDTVVDSLEKHGYTVTFIDKVMIGVSKVPESGWYTLHKRAYGRFNFYRNIYKHRTESMDIVVFAGETHTELIKRLANDMKLDIQKLKEQYKKRTRFFEADIFAGHYKIARKADEKATLTYLFDISDKMLDLFIEKNFRERPDRFELKVLLTIASIIQKESNSVNEMPLISAVIYNRLKKNMRLQMDATLNYGKWSHQIVTPKRIKSDNSYYNTYKHKGLPPFPLGTISLEALRAAMFPEKNAYLFFMLKPDGSHNFCATYEQHLENIKTFRNYQRERDEKRKKEAKRLEKEKPCRIENNVTKEGNTTNVREKKGESNSSR